MTTADGNKNYVDPRFLSRFSIVNLVLSDDTTMKNVFKSILKGYLEPFSESIKSAIDSVVNMSINLFKTISTELPTTPCNYHYVFNMKDLSRVYAGLSCISPTIFIDAKQLIRVWRNEFTRVFFDRLNSAKDLELVKSLLTSEVHRHYPPAELKKYLRKSQPSIKETLIEMPLNQYTLRNPLLFGDFRHGIVDDEERSYEDLLDYGAVLHLFKEIIDEYNRKNEPINLVLFDDFLDHLIRVHRILRIHK